MVSAKGLLYTAVAATAAAVIVGTMLTPERRAKVIDYAKNNSGPLLEKAKSLISSLSSGQPAGKSTAS